MKRREQGFGIAPVLALVVVVAVIGLVGYTLWQRTHPSVVVTPADQQAVEVAPTIKNKADLDTALRALDKTDIAGTTTQDIDSETNF